MNTKFEIHELLNSKNYIENINEEQFFKLMKNYKVNVRFPIYRMIKSQYKIYNNFYSDINIVNPRIIDRVAPYSESNLHNLYLSNAETWSNFPKRNKSLIGGDHDISSRSGKVMVVIPLEDRKIAVAPDDIWVSFKYLFGNINNFFKKIKTLKGIETWEELDKYIKTDDLKDKDFNFIIRLHVNSDFEYKQQYLNGFISRLEFFNLLFSPELNGFKLYDYSKLRYTSANKFYREIWTDSKSVLIDVELYNVLINKLQKF